MHNLIQWLIFLIIINGAIDAEYEILELFLTTLHNERWIHLLLLIRIFFMFHFNLRNIQTYSNIIVLIEQSFMKYYANF